MRDKDCTGYTADMINNNFYNNRGKYSYVPAGYIRNSFNYSSYLKFNNTICQLNFECESTKTLKFSQLTKFYAIYTPLDGAIRPVTASIMDTLKPNSYDIWRLEDQPIYEKLGIKELKEQKRFFKCRFDDIGYGHNTFRKEEFYKDYFWKILKGIEID